MDGAPSFSVLDFSPTEAAFFEDALWGLTQPAKTLSGKWLYDQRGSELFERVTQAPEYYLTRTEAAILRAHARDLAGLVPAGGALVELGSGASVKTRTLLDAGGHFGAYVPMDISASFLRQTADALRGAYPDLSISPVIGDFTGPVDLPEAVSAMPKVGFFPGTTVGNLEPALAVEVLAHARAWPGVEGFILGADLVKCPTELVAAYDDAGGANADFVGNMLVRMNRDLGAGFDTDAFRHEALWNEDASRVEMRLISTTAQIADLCGTPIGFATGEPIHIAASRKYTPASLASLVTLAGWRVQELVTDPAQRFAVAVLIPD